MAIVKKITTGFVVQEFDTESQQFVSQEFIAGDDVQFENEMGESVEEIEKSLNFDMKQPYKHFLGEPTTVGEIIQKLKGYDPNIKMIGAFWQEDDFRQCHMDDNGNSELDEDFEGKPFTDAEITELMRITSHSHDAEQGINWDVIGCQVDMFERE